MQESSTKPYLIRALHEWCTDNGYTPHIVVSVDDNTVVPLAHIHEGQITLNIGTLATSHLILGNEYIEFQARFSGAVEDIVVPIAAVAAIYARETGTGMGFDVTPSTAYPGDVPDPVPAPDPTRSTSRGTTTPDKDGNGGGKPRGPGLRVIK